MRDRLIISIILFCMIGLPIHAQSQYSEKGVLYPESFGAKGNGTHDDTEAIQKAIDNLVKIGGGTVRLGTGTYLVTSIRLGPKVSLVGNGNGATVIKQSKGLKSDCIVVRDIAAALKISDLTVLGENENRGIFFEPSGGFGENHHYLYSNTASWDKSQAYKWITIENVCVYKFEVGIYISKAGYNTNICNSTFSYNGKGVFMACTDCSIYNCYITNNSKHGLVVVGGDNKISNIKSIFNGRDNPKEYGAITIKANGCQVINCETQDNYGKGYIVEGMYNLFSNCKSNTDGYSKDPFQYDPTVEACGFMIKGPYNSFSNCAVTNYNEKYGAVYHSPVIVEESILHYYPDIYYDIKVINAPDRLMFNEPYRNIQALSSKNHIKKLSVGSVNGENYYVRNQQPANIIKGEEVHTCSLQILVDFKDLGSGGNVIEIDGDKSLNVDVEKNSIKLNWQGEKKAELTLDDDAVMDKDDLRLVISFSQNGGQMCVQLLMFEKTTDRGWIKKTAREETDIPSVAIKNAKVKIGDSKIPVKRVVVTQTPLPESVFLPLSNLNNIYDSATVYVDADTSL